MKVGLRIDVDTFRGTRDGVPNLCRLLAAHSTKATFFFCVGPDNMGRHLWRLIRPSFLVKMLRTKAANLYGWDILLRGTFWPGPIIGDKLGPIIQGAASMGHEIGLHAWDHHAWQARIDSMNSLAISRCLDQGFKKISTILGKPPTCSAAPAWKGNDRVLAEKLKFPFRFNSDCRGKNIFRPIVNGEAISQPQIPVTLPTYDEVVGRDGISDANYNDHLHSLLNDAGLNVLTIHAEVEGLSKIALFDQFLRMVLSDDVDLVPLGELLPPSVARTGRMVQQEIPGREGWVACESTTT